MTLKEFNAWLDGFSESINGSPNKEQWKKIQAKIALIKPDKEVTVERVRYNDYWIPRPWYPTGITWTSSSGATGGSMANSKIADLAITQTPRSTYSTQLESQAYQIGMLEGAEA